MTTRLPRHRRARPRPARPASHPRIATLRSFEDALAIKAALAAAQRVLVLGGGWIGLEVAASARLQGKDATALEAAPRLCLRTVPPCVSEHRCACTSRTAVAARRQRGPGRRASDHGVTVCWPAAPSIAGDLPVVGIGPLRRRRPGRRRRLAGDNGVLTDASGRTADPAIFAVGDVANALRADGRRLRIESWENAQRQAMAAASAALGIAFDPETAGPPVVRSDQPTPTSSCSSCPTSHRVIERRAVRREPRPFFFCDGSRARAVAAVNAGREIKIARKWMQQNRHPALERSADPAQDLAELPTSPPHPIGPNRSCRGRRDNPSEWGRHRMRLLRWSTITPFVPRRHGTVRFCHPRPADRGVPRGQCC